jgi:hypothetical protein
MHDFAVFQISPIFIYQADWVGSAQLPDHGSTVLETKKKTGHPAVSSAVADLAPGHPAVSSAVSDLTPGHHNSWVSTHLDEQKKNLGSIHGFLATLHTMKI